MSEVKRYDMCGFEGGLVECKDGTWYHMDDFDRVTAELDTALGCEAVLRDELGAAKGEYDRAVNKVDALQQRLTAADERADVLEGLLRDSKDVMSGIWDTSYDHEAGDALAALDLMGRIDAELKPAKMLTADHKCIECDSEYCHGVCVERGDSDDRLIG